MYIHMVPYELIEWLFGKTIADNFNTISLCLCVIGAMIALFLPRKPKVVRYRKTDKDPVYVEEDEEGRLVYKGIDKEMPKEEPKKYQPQQGQQSPTGWYYDEDVKKWNPPEYLAEESARKWRWDEEKQIWIDQEKEYRLRRYQEYRRSQGKGPTYEEWKAAREAEKHLDD